MEGDLVSVGVGEGERATEGAVDRTRHDRVAVGRQGVVNCLDVGGVEPDRGADSGLPNTNGAGPLVATQAERAASFRRYVTRALRKPALIGYHWFEHADQPAEGRFDGENSNFGTVKIDDLVYEDLVHAMTLSNDEAEALHAAVVLGA